MLLSIMADFNIGQFFLNTNKYSCSFWTVFKLFLGMLCILNCLLYLLQIIIRVTTSQGQLVADAMYSNQHTVSVFEFGCNSMLTPCHQRPRPIWHKAPHFVHRKLFFQKTSTLTVSISANFYSKKRILKEKTFSVHWVTGNIVAKDVLAP